MPWGGLAGSHFVAAIWRKGSPVYNDVAYSLLLRAELGIGALACGVYLQTQTANPMQTRPAWTRAHPTRRMQLGRLAWSIVERTFYRSSFHTWNSWRAMLLRLFGAKIGRQCVLRRTSKVFYPWLLTMGNNSTLGDLAQVYNLGQVTIEDWVTVSQEAYICAGSHDYRVKGMPLVVAPVIIKSQSWICARAFVSPGITIGQGAIVAAAAVATHDVPDWTIVGGNPAVFLKSRPLPQAE